MKVDLRRKDELFYLVDGDQDIPLTRDAYYMAIQDNIKAVEISGEHRLLPYEELLEILKGICSDELSLMADRFDDGDLS